MKFINYKHKSGYLIDIKKSEQMKVGGIAFTGTWDVSELVPIKKNDGADLQKITINLNDLYQDLYTCVIKIKDNKLEIREAILNLANKWGSLNCNSETFENLFGTSDTEAELNAEYKLLFRQALSERYVPVNEYRDWKLLLQKVIPNTQNFLQTYIKKNHLELSLVEYNFCVRDTRVQYKSVNLSSLDLIPQTLLSAITIFSQTKRDRRKKTTTIICAYENCNNEVTDNLGPGRPRVTCSDSCRTLKAKHRNKKS